MAEYCYVSNPIKRKKNGKAQSILLHRKIWIDNFGEIPNNSVIHHIDGNKKNNRIENLKLLTRREHSLLHSRAKKNEKGTGGITKKT